MHFFLRTLCMRLLVSQITFSTLLIYKILTNILTYNFNVAYSLRNKHYYTKSLFKITLTPTFSGAQVFSNPDTKLVFFS